MRKNVQFSILIKIEGRLREFNFRKRSENSYDGNVTDSPGDRYLFIWHRENSDWKLERKFQDDPALPVWLINNTSTIRESFLTEIL